jgi:hypothetical protein
MEYKAGFVNQPRQALQLLYGIVRREEGLIQSFLKV